MSPTVRLFAAAACFAAWLVLLFLGHIAGGAVHLLAGLAVALFVWRRRSESRSHREESPWPSSSESS